jgi:uncharacterized protein (DUF1810 family)
MEDKFDLNRFLDAQSIKYEQALIEINSGKKTSDWIWYIFPQYKGLGISSTSIKYAISSVEEAKEYFNHPILRDRLIEISGAFLCIENKSAYDILGRIDKLKMKSCMTLFDAIQTETDVFSRVINKYFSGSKCSRTISQIKKS